MKALSLSYDILSLVDTNTTRDLTFKDVLTYQATSPSVAIQILNKNIQTKLIFKSDHIITIKILNLSLLFTAYYIRPNSNEDTTGHYNKLRSILRSSSEHIVMGDLNGPIEEIDGWSDPRGDEIQLLILNKGWSLLNTAGEFTHIHHTGDCSSPDWAFATGDIAPHCAWQIDKSFDSSIDHRMMMIDYRTQLNLSSLHKVIIRPRVFLQKIKELTANSPIEMWFQHFTAALSMAEKEVPFNFTENFWTPQLEAEKSQIISLISTIKRRKFIDSPVIILSLKDKLKRLNKTHKSNVNYAKTNARVNKLADAKGAEVFKTLASTLKTRNRHCVQSLQVDGDTLSDPVQVANIILDRFYPAQSDSGGSFDDISSGGPDDLPVTWYEIYAALSTTKPNKAPGLDRVSYDLLKIWFHADANYWIKLINFWFSSKIFPEQFKDSLVVPIIKNVAQGNRVDNIRPIGLLSTLSKVYEKILRSRIQHLCETTHYFGVEQHGFRPKVSTTTALQTIQQERLLNKGHRHELMISLDIKGAFDNVFHRSIIQALSTFNCPANILQIIKSYFKNRRAVINICGNSVSRPMTRGVIQGGAISPFLFILTLELALREIRAAINSLTNAKVKMVVFADDINWIISSTDGFARPIQVAQQLFIKTNAALSKLGLQLSAPKTQLMITNHANVRMKIHLGDNIVGFNNNIKILGVNFSHDLTFTFHLETVTAKARAKLKRLMPTLRIKNGLTREARSLLVTAVIYPMVTYSAHIWFSSSPPIFNILGKFGRELTIATTNAYATISRASALAIAPVIPIQYSAWRIHDRYLALAKRTGNGHIALEKPPNIDDFDYPPMRTLLEINQHIRTADQYEDATRGVAVFTDGSKTADSAGAAFILYRDQEKIDQQLIKLPPHATIFQCELMAICAALDYLEHNNFTYAKIFTDSMSSLQAITNPITTSKLALNIHHKIRHNSSNGRYYHLNWIKAHNQLSGNEAADFLANLARTTGELGFVPVSAALIKRQINQKIRQKLNNDYLSQQWGRTIKQFVPNLLSGANKALILTATTVLIYTGHLPTNHYLAERKKIESPLCTCGQLQTVVHLISVCPHQNQINVATAVEAKLPLAVLHGPTSDFTTHRKIHRYIYLRAPSLISYLAEVNDQRKSAEALDMGQLFISSEAQVLRRNQAINDRIHPITDDTPPFAYNWIPHNQPVQPLRSIENDDESSPSKRRRTITPILIQRNMDGLRDLEQNRKRLRLHRTIDDQVQYIDDEYHSNVHTNADQISSRGELQLPRHMTWRQDHTESEPENDGDLLQTAPQYVNSQ